MARARKRLQLGYICFCLCLPSPALATNWWTYAIYASTSPTCQLGTENSHFQSPSYQQAQVGQCMVHRLAPGFSWFEDGETHTSWSMKVDSCTPGQPLVIKEYLSEDCSGESRMNPSTFNDGVCAHGQDLYARATCSATRPVAFPGVAWSFDVYKFGSNCGVLNGVMNRSRQQAAVGECMNHEVAKGALKGTKWSMMVKGCLKNQRVLIFEYQGHDCVDKNGGRDRKGAGIRHEVFYRDGECVSVYGEESRATCIVDEKDETGSGMWDTWAGNPPPTVPPTAAPGASNSSTNQNGMSGADFNTADPMGVTSTGDITVKMSTANATLLTANVTRAKSIFASAIAMSINVTNMTSDNVTITNIKLDGLEITSNYSSTEEVTMEVGWEVRASRGLDITDFSVDMLYTNILNAAFNALGSNITITGLTVFVLPQWNTGSTSGCVERSVLTSIAFAIVPLFTFI